jgi:hypothetical protein
MARMCARISPPVPGLGALFAAAMLVGVSSMTFQVAA